MNLTEFQSQAHVFLTTLFSSLQTQGLDLGFWSIDHLCYRVETLERYRILRTQFREFANLLIESEIRGRPIATFKLHQPIHFQKYRIDLIELPAPKAGKLSREGFEHIEVVADLTPAEIQKRFPLLQFDASGLEKELNPELEWTGPAGSVKFHPLSLESVIRLESVQPLWSTISSLRIFEKLKGHSYLIAGHYPLGLQQKHSPILIYLQSGEFQALQKKFGESFSRARHLNFRSELRRGLPTMLVSFSMLGLSFEIQVQDVAPVHQEGYRKFQAAEKILRFAGPRVRQWLNENLESDELLTIQIWTETQVDEWVKGKENAS